MCIENNKLKNPSLCDYVWQPFKNYKWFLTSSKQKEFQRVAFRVFTFHKGQHILKCRKEVSLFYGWMTLEVKAWGWEGWQLAGWIRLFNIQFEANQIPDICLQKQNKMTQNWMIHIGKKNDQKRAKYFNTIQPKPTKILDTVKYSY